MLDAQFIREHPDIITQAARDKNVPCDVPAFLKLDATRRKLISEIDDMRKQKNTISQSIQQLTAGKQAVKNTDLIQQSRELGKALALAEDKLSTIQDDWTNALLQFPNIPSADTPVGKDESQNVVKKTVGTLPQFSFPCRDHTEIGSMLDIIDKGRAAQVSGARFAYLKGDGALLEFALIHYAMSVLTNSETLFEIIQKNKLKIPATPFIPIIPPVLVKSEVMKKMARHEPSEERYILDKDELFLVGSAEHALGPMHMNETIPEDKLPIRYIGFSSSFRREAGSYGKDTKGILRMHQFDKLEMESFSSPETSLEEQNLMVAIQEHLMASLDLPYRVVHICTGDMGKPDFRQIDIETWLPGQNRYRETQTSDLMTDYQSRRLHIKTLRKNGASDFVHMNDATAYAIGRTIVAILENHQNADGTVNVPKKLQPFIFGKSIIGAYAIRS